MRLFKFFASASLILIWPSLLLQATGDESSSVFMVILPEYNVENVDLRTAAERVLESFREANPKDARLRGIVIAADGGEWAVAPVTAHLKNVPVGAAFSIIARLALASVSEENGIVTFLGPSRFATTKSVDLIEISPDVRKILNFPISGNVENVLPTMERYGIHVDQIERADYYVADSFILVRGSVVEIRLFQSIVELLRRGMLLRSRVAVGSGE